jgi:hypothetical protein
LPKKLLYILFASNYRNTENILKTHQIVDSVCALANRIVNTFEIFRYLSKYIASSIQKAYEVRAHHTCLHASRSSF